MDTSIDRHAEQGAKPSLYLPQLDGLRFWAFFLVFVHHHDLLAGTPLHFLKEEGWIGVDLFFALSAFLFSRLLAEEIGRTGRLSVRRFYLRRILRIWPAYFAYLALCIGATLWVGHLDRETLFHRSLGLAVFVDNIVSARHGYSPILLTPHLWSIGYEEQFYLALPPALFLFSRLEGKLRIAGIVLLVILGLSAKAFLIARGDAALSVWTLPWVHFESVALGALLAWKGLVPLRQKLSPSASLLLAGLCFAGQSALPPAETTSFLLFPKYLLSALAPVLAIHAATSGGTFGRWLSRPLLVHLGKRSYGLYLYHLAAMVLFDRLLALVPGMHPGGTTSFAGGLLLAWLAAYLSYRWWEAPFLKLKQRFEVVVSRPSEELE